MDGTIEHAEKTNKEIVQQQPTPVEKSVSYLSKIAKEIIAIIVWLYVLVKLFIFDIDVFLVNNFFSEYTWFLNLKFFIFIGAIAILLLITKNKYLLTWSLYTVFYPMIILFWKVPFFVFKQRSWVFAFAFINAVISFFKSIKYNFITSAFFLVSIAVIFSFSREMLLWLATATLFILLLITYIHRFILVFKPSSIFQVHIKIFSGIRKQVISSFALDENIKNLPLENLDKKQLEKWTTNLQTSVLYNRICLFAAKKLRDYQSSGLNVVSYVLTIFLLIAFTIFSFAAINYGLYKIDSNIFDLAALPTFFTFFYYSFNNLLFNSIQEITPIMPISQTTSMIESFFALFLIVIFVSLLFSVRSQKHSEELNEVVKRIKEEGKFMEQFIADEYKLVNIEAAISELERLKSGLVNFIYQLSKNT